MYIHTCIYIYIYRYTHVCVYIYIYIERERDYVDYLSLSLLLEPAAAKGPRARTRERCLRHRLENLAVLLRDFKSNRFLHILGLLFSHV